MQCTRHWLWLPTVTVKINKNFYSKNNNHNNNNKMKFNAIRNHWSNATFLCRAVSNANDTHSWTTKLARYFFQSSHQVSIFVRYKNKTRQKQTFEGALQTLARRRSETELRRRQPLNVSTGVTLLWKLNYFACKSSEKLLFQANSGNNNKNEANCHPCG